MCWQKRKGRRLRPAPFVCSFSTRLTNGASQWPIILLVNWTDQDIRNIKDSAQRLDAGRALAKEQGCVLESFFMNMGSFDNVAVIDAPDDETFAKYVLTLGSEGNLRTVTLKAFPEEAYRTIIAELA